MERRATPWVVRALDKLLSFFLELRGREDLEVAFAGGSLVSFTVANGREVEGTKEDEAPEREKCDM